MLRCQILRCLTCLKLPNSRTYAADCRKYASARTSLRRKRAGADELLEQLDHFRLAGNFSIQERTHRGGAEGVLRLSSGCAAIKNFTRGDSSTGSELKAVEEACREASRTVEP